MTSLSSGKAKGAAPRANGMRLAARGAVRVGVFCHRDRVTEKFHARGTKHGDGLPLDAKNLIPQIEFFST